MCNSSQRWRARFDAVQRSSLQPCGSRALLCSLCSRRAAVLLLPSALQLLATAIDNFGAYGSLPTPLLFRLYGTVGLGWQQTRLTTCSAAERAFAVLPTLHSLTRRTAHRATTPRTHCTTKRATRCTCSAQASHHTCTARIVSKDGRTRRQRRPLPTQTTRNRKPEIDLCRLRRGQNKMHLPRRPPRPQGHETADAALTHERRDAGGLRALDAAQGPALRLPATAGPQMV